MNEDHPATVVPKDFEVTTTTETTVEDKPAEPDVKIDVNVEADEPDKDEEDE